MECTKPMSMKHPKTAMWLTHRCGQCLPCRIAKQSNWVLRNRLELTSAYSASFWTLTLDNAGLQSLATLGPRRIIRNFFVALRQNEQRHGNKTMIRYFGCLEFGGKFGRPHFHFLIYNLMRNRFEGSVYRPGLPRPQIHSTLWPYGHIDLGTVNPASMRYVASYMTEFREPGSANILYSTRRPAIGFYGLDKLAATLARRHSSLPEVSSLTIGAKQYPLDMWTRKTLRERFQAHGIKTKRLDPMERKLQALSLDVAKAEIYDPVRQRQKAEELRLRHERQKQAAAASDTRAYAAVSAKSGTRSGSAQDSPPPEPNSSSSCVA